MANYFPQCFGGVNVCQRFSPAVWLTLCLLHSASLNMFPYWALTPEDGTVDSLFHPMPSLQRHHHRKPILIYPGQHFLSSNDEFSFKSHFELFWMTALKWVSGANNNRKGGAVESKKLLLDEVNLTVLLFRSLSLFGKKKWRAFLSLDSVLAAVLLDLVKF